MEDTGGLSLDWGKPGRFSATCWKLSCETTATQNFFHSFADSRRISCQLNELMVKDWVLITSKVHCPRTVWFSN